MLKWNDDSNGLRILESPSLGCCSVAAAACPPGFEQMAGLRWPRVDVLALMFVLSSVRRSVHPISVVI